MAFEKYTAPPPPKKPHIKFTRSIIQITDSGFDKLGELAAKLKEASHVHLWHDSETHQVAITPAPANDPDAFTFENGKIQAKKFLEKFGISYPVKKHDKFLQPHYDGVKLSVGNGNASSPASKVSAQAAPDPKPSKAKKAPWKPGDPIPPRGRKSAAQLAWLAEQKVATEGAVEEKERGEG